MGEATNRECRQVLHSSGQRICRFGEFTVDLRTRELWKASRRLSLQEKPFRLLVELLQAGGDVVTRKQLQQALWPDGTHVDYEVGLHNAVRKLRQALGDSVESPRFVETLPCVGYRFLAHVAAADQLRPQPRHTPAKRGSLGLLWTLAALLLAAGLVLAWGTLVRWEPGAGMQPLRSQAATEAYLSGRYELGRGNPLRAVEFFEDATAEDAGYAEAFAGLSSALTRLALDGQMETDEAALRAEGAARRAIALDPQLAQGHRALGSALLWVRWEFDSARASLERALALDPVSAETLQLLAVQASVTGRSDEAIRWKRQAVESDPEAYRIRADLGYHLLAGGNLPEAIHESRRVLQIEPDYAPARQVLLQAFLKQGDWKAACQQARQLMVHSEAAPQQVALMDRLSPRQALAHFQRWRLDQTRQKVLQKKAPALRLAASYAALGDPVNALKWIERSYRDREPQTIFVRCDPEFDALRSDPSYLKLLSRIGFPQI